jgi:histidinol phosphatase-like enzyme
MSTQDLNNIHNNMKFEINANGGRIDKFYHADSLNDDDPIRKPNTGMGLQAQKDFPEINFSKSIMVGNNLSDMEFGKSLGMFTIYVHTTKKLSVIDSNIIDADFKNFTSIF